MEKLTTKKRLTIVRHYFSGLSYDEIAVKSGVSKGTVANVITDLKAGKFPEASDAREDVELLRELSLDLKRSGLTLGQCAVGLNVLTRINDCGLDPADTDRWPMILNSVGSENDTQEFVRLVYGIEEVQKKTGLSLEALDNKAHELEKKAADLEPISNKLQDYQKQVTELTGQREKLANVVANLEEKYKLLNPRVNDLEKREHTLSRRIADTEPKAQQAEKSLSALKGEMQRLQDIGLSLKELAEFNGRLQIVAQHHAIKPTKLTDRLLHELETLDKGLELETLIQSRQQELDKTEQAITRSKKEIEVTRSTTGSLKQEKVKLDADIKETREKVSREIAKIIPLARDTIDRLGKDLRRGNEEALSDVRQLRDEAVKVGKEVGRYEGILQVNEWLNELLALVRGEESLKAKRVRTIALLVLRGTSAWFKHNEPGKVRYSIMPYTLDNLIKELEAWEA